MTEKQLNQINDMSLSLINALYESMPNMDDLFYERAATLLQLRYELPGQGNTTCTEVLQVTDMLESILDNMYQSMPNVDINYAVLVNTFRHILDTY
jgi:hypothetical protein